MNPIRKGALGYLNKEYDPEEIAKAVHRGARKALRYISPYLAELLAGELNNKQSVPAHELLSEDEFQVFLKLARGDSVGVVGEALSLSVKTVSTYRTRLMEKLKLSTNSDSTYYALKAKVID